MEWFKICEGRWESKDSRWSIMRNDEKGQFVIGDNGRLIDHHLLDSQPYSGDVLIFTSKKDAKRFAEALQVIEDLWLSSSDPSWRDFDLLEDD